MERRMDKKRTLKAAESLEVLNLLTASSYDWYKALLRSCKSTTCAVKGGGGFQCDFCGDGGCYGDGGFYGDGGCYGEGGYYGWW